MMAREVMESEYDGRVIVSDGDWRVVSRARSKPLMGDDQRGNFCID